MTQIAARALGADISRVHVAETATDKVPNSSPSAASASSDLYGLAVLQVRQLQRLTVVLRNTRPAIMNIRHCSAQANANANAKANANANANVGRLLPIKL